MTTQYKYNVIERCGQDRVCRYKTDSKQDAINYVIWMRSRYRNAWYEETTQHTAFCAN